MKARNPVLPLQYYCPDGEPHLIGGELFVYPSFDTTPEEATCYEELPQYIANYIPRWFRMFPFGWFQKLVRIIVNRMSGDAGKRLLYAPDSVTIGGKSYLFFCTSDGREGVAVSDSPAGPFRDPVQITSDKSGEPISGIDPAVFRDDDGRVYLYWGQIHSCGAELTDDLTKIKEDTLVRGLLTEREHGFHEGSSMRKIGDTYYYIFADTHRGKPTALGYATSKSPLGPFTYQGVIIDNADCDPEIWNNHGSIECVDGQWYVFYHRSTGNSRFLRRMCAEPIAVGADGRIAEVLPTSIGMGEPYKPGEALCGYQACKLTNAYIEGDKLVVPKGQAEVGYRYLDSSAAGFSSVAFDGVGSATLSAAVDERGELTIHIDAKEDTQIKSFALRG